VTGDYAKSKSVSGLVGALLSTGGHGLRSIMHTGADSIHIENLHTEPDKLHTAR
jgi:hypothetical protein